MDMICGRRQILKYFCNLCFVPFLPPPPEIANQTPYFTEWHLRSLYIKDHHNIQSSTDFFKIHEETDIRDLNIKFIRQGKILYVDLKFTNNYKDLIITKIFSNKIHFKKLTNLTLLKRKGQELIGFKVISKIEKKLDLSNKKLIRNITPNYYYFLT